MVVYYTNENILVYDPLLIDGSLLYQWQKK
jgi:hypothetical protein